jgi:DNA-binding NarL/FixJ family response regulator
MPYGNGNAEPVIYLLAQHALDRAAYRALLAAELGCRVTVESGLAPTSVWAAMRTNPALVIVAADSPQRPVCDVLHMVARLRPETRILVVTDATRPGQIEAWSRCPLHGYVGKDDGVDELRAAVRALLDGREHYSAAFADALTRAAARPPSMPQLSPRETELLPLLARGVTLRDAAGQMGVSYKTADGYRSSLLRKLGVHDRVQLARLAIRQRIIDP